MKRPLFVVFEGIDGSGKTTLSGAVARTLRRQGLRVEHVREGGRFSSPIVQRIRELGRDARNALLCHDAELLLFLARDAQLLDEAILPALERADVVIADRYFHTAEVLARFGRGLPEARVSPLVAEFARRREPDLVVLVDADPHVALARRRARKVLHPDPKPPSRKGLSGAALQHRLRRGYLELAARDPGRWFVLPNDGVPLSRAEARALGAVRAALAGQPVGSDGLTRNVSARLPAIPCPEAARAAFLAWIDRCAAREPAVAAYFLSGAHGPGFDERRLALAETEAAPVVAWGLRGLDDAVSWRLRRALSGRAPAPVARSLERVAGAEASRLRRVLAAEAGGAVAESLEGDDEETWWLRDALRERHPLEVVGSLGGLDGERSWALREGWLAATGGLDALSDVASARAAARSVRGLGSERAWEIRLAALAGSPPDALASLAGLHDRRSWELRERYAGRAGKIVFRTLAAVDDPRAWQLREAWAPRCKEAVDSITGLDAPAAWRLRDALADEWPSTVVKSLGALAATAAGRRLAARQLARYPEHPSLLKHAAMLYAPPRATMAAG